MPTGHLHTFDFHQQRVEIVTKEFSDHGLGEFVTVKQRDACKDGYDMEDKADAVFLDLPSPWLVVSHAAKTLKKSGKILCSFLAQSSHIFIFLFLSSQEFFINL